MLGNLKAKTLRAVCLALSLVLLLWAIEARLASSWADAAGQEASAHAVLGGAVFRDCADCPQMLKVPGGKFVFSGKPAYDGRLDDDPESKSKSIPAYDVMIGSGLSAGLYPVTRAEFSRFVKESGLTFNRGCLGWSGDQWAYQPKLSWQNPGFRQSPQDPAVCVSAWMAQMYVDWLNSKLTMSGQEGIYRLPTWEEAEYLAGGGESTAYPWGNQISHAQANYGAKGCEPCRAHKEAPDRWLFTSPVGSFPANAFGLYDVAGNVWQITADCVTRTETRLLQRMAKPGEYCLHITRGGSWLSSADYLRTGEFSFIGPVVGDTSTGFRLVKGVSRNGGERVE